MSLLWNVVHWGLTVVGLAVVAVFVVAFALDIGDRLQR